MKMVFAIGLGLFLATVAHAQEGEQPTAFTTAVQPLETVQRVVMPAVDEAALKAEDERRFADTGEKAQRYAANLTVDLTPETAGTWERLDSGELLWRLRVYSKGARSLNFAFDQYFMPEGGRLFIYSADGKHFYRPFTADDNEDHGELWTPPVFGPETVLELTIPESARGALKLHLALVNHDYRGFGQPNMEKSGACNIDIVCPISNPYNDQERANAVISTGGSTFCSGSLVNNTANDTRPFFMSADHCLSAGQAPSLVVFWNYFNSTCRPVNSPESGQPGDGSLSQFNTGAIFRAENAATDFHLVELDDAPLPAFNVFFAGWDRTPNPTQFTSTVAIHHPSTDEMRITFAPGTTESGGWPPSVPGDGSHIHANWGTDLGVTEPGSSGSPLYTQQGRYIGQLHGGPSACGAADLSDYYGRFSGSWTGGGTNSTRLSNWLDPLGTAPITLDGINGCTAPAAPAGVSATATTPNTIQVTWSAVGGATGYNVYRSNGACPGTTFGLVGNNVSGTTFDDTTVSGGNTYSYVVRSIQVCESVNSTCDDAVATGSCTTPPTFAGLGSVTQPTPGSCRLDLAWTAGTATCAGATLKYNVYRSTSPGFPPGAGNLIQSCVTGTSFSDVTVTPGSTNYYVVRAEDSTASGSGACNSGNEETNLVYKSGNPDTIAAFNDDIESGTANWVLDSPGAGNPWAVVTTQSHSATHAWFSDEPAIVKDKRVAFAADATISAGATLSFWHRINAETNAACTPNSLCDGGVLEYSTNGGANWFDILAGNGGSIPPNAGRFVAGAYTGILNTVAAFGNPLAGRQGWGGDNAAFAEVRVNLADFSGIPARFRWRFATDNSVADGGWWVDDVLITRQQACTPVGAPTISIGDASVPEGNTGSSNATFTVSLSHSSADTVTVQVDTADGTATAPGDYTAISGATVTFVPGDTAETVNVPVSGDQSFEANETFFVNLSAPVNASIADGQGIGTIVNDDLLRGDFNADGKTDILWRHDVSGGNVAWFMNGTTLSSGTFLTPATLSDVNWKMVGTHDFNADLKTDILWRHEVSGENVVWYMNGTALTSGTFLTPAALVDTNWKMAGTGLFNAGTQPDIVWHHQVSGQVVIWYMNGSVMTSGTLTTPSSLPDTNWRLRGVADFNADGHPDLLWHHKGSGQIVVWYMDNATMLSGTITTPSSVPDVNWQIVAVGDYSVPLDGKPDIVWRHGISGQNAIWLMNGVTLTSGVLTTTLPDPNWKIVGPR